MVDRLDSSQTANSQATVLAKASGTLNLVSSVAMHVSGDSWRILTMPLFKYFGSVGPALLVVIFVTDAYFRDDERNLRFNGSFYESALYAPRLEETVAAQERHFTRDVTPAARVKEIFAQFIPNEGRRIRR
jgi:hypothetical protein